MRITVLAGGLTPERDVSLTTSVKAAEALRERGHEVAVIDLFCGVEEPIEDMDAFFAAGGTIREGGISTTAPDLEALKAGRRDKSPSRIGEQVLKVCQAADIVFIGIHGGDGENGNLQAMLDMLGVKYTGGDTLGCALAMDKPAAKTMFAAAGLQVPGGCVIRRGQPVPQELPLPCFVKPCHGGSSVATTMLEDMSGLPEALAAVFACNDDALVEPYIRGREVQVGLLGDQALPPIEIVCDHGFFDYEMKYQAGACREICPAPIDADATARLQEAALTAFRAVGLAVYSRADFILCPDGSIWLLEINPLPGMTPTSLVPQEAAAVGISYGELCQRIVDLSLAKYEKRN